MGGRSKRIAVGVVLTLAAVTPAQAGGPATPLDFGNQWIGQRNAVVEQQSDQQWPEPPRYSPDRQRYVVNPTANCKWNADDNSQQGQGTQSLAAGATATGSRCRIVDFNPSFVCINGTCANWSFGKHGSVGFRVRAPSPHLVISMSWSPQGKTFTLTPTWNAAERTYHYGPICVNALYVPDDPALGAIAGSNGSTHPDSVEGRGVLTTVSFSATNPTSKTVKPIAWSISIIGASQPAGDQDCPDGQANDLIGDTIPRQVEYPFTWYQGG